MKSKFSSYNLLITKFRRDGFGRFFETSKEEEKEESEEVDESKEIDESEEIVDAFNTFHIVCRVDCDCSQENVLGIHQSCEIIIFNSRFINT